MSSGEFIGLVPPSEGFVQTSQFNFSRYSEIPAYRQVNYDLIDRVLDLLPKRFTALEVGMGHGMVSRRVSARVDGADRYVRQFGVDLDAYATSAASSSIHDTANVKNTFLQGDACDLESVLAGYLQPEEVDYGSMHDFLHEVRDNNSKARIVRSLAHMLVAGGLVSFNSAFTTAAVGREWALWQGAFMELFGAKKYKPEEGQPVIERLPIETPDFYTDLMTAVGLAVIHNQKVKVPHNQDALEAISEYPPFARGFAEMMIFPQPVTLADAVDGMKRSIIPVFDRLRVREFQRTWVESIAQKPS